MTNPLRIGTVLLLAAALTACAGVRVSQDYDADASFSHFHSWTWMPGEPQPTGDYRLDSPLIDARVRTAVERTLTARGFVKVGAIEQADFLVDYHLSLDSKTEVRTYGTGIGWTRYHSWGSVGVETHVDQYEEGTLVIDIADARAQRLVWRGWGTRRLRRYPTPEQTTQSINETVSEVLAQFPPR